MKTFVLNHPPFQERKNKIITKLSEEDINFEIVDKFSPGEFDYDSITNTDYDIHRGIYIEQILNYSYLNNPNKVPQNSISLVLKHIHCWKEQLSQRIENILILEDDCMIPDNFRRLIELVEKEMKLNHCDIVMLGECYDFIVQEETENLISYNKLYKTRCTHAYILNIKASATMLNGFNCINNSIDFKMNEVIQLNQLRVGWLVSGLKQIDK